MKAKRIRLWIGIPISAMSMLVLTFYLMSLPWLASDEKFLIWSSSTAKLMFREMPDPNDYALINTSYDLALIDKYDDFGFPVGKQVITDRSQLTFLMNAIASAPIQPKITLLDIHLIDSTEYDKELEASMQQIPNLILSAHLDDHGSLEPPVIRGVKYGISDYVIGNVFDGVYKYQLFHNDSMKLTPLKMYEMYSGKWASKTWFGAHVDNEWMPNNFIIDYRLLQKDIKSLDAGFNPINLGELLFLPDADIQEFVADKIVVIGDFLENDMHETLFEETAGPVILINVFLSILDSAVYFDLWFILLLLAVYGYLSYMAFYDGDYLEVNLRKVFGEKNFLKTLAGFVNYLLVLTVLSLITFFIYGIHLNVFYLALAFNILDKVSHFINRKTHSS